MWSIPEIREALEDAGLKNTIVYWEGDDDDDEQAEGDGEFFACEQSEQLESWVAYIGAYKKK